jgi:DNA-binding Xre family transcriptional regulator
MNEGIKTLTGKLHSRFLILLTEKERREGRRIRNVEIAAATGVSLQLVGRWMRNEVTKFEAPILEKFCDYFDCDVGDLLYIEKEQKPA